MKRHLAEMLHTFLGTKVPERPLMPHQSHYRPIDSGGPELAHVAAGQLSRESTAQTLVGPRTGPATARFLTSVTALSPVPFDPSARGGRVPVTVEAPHKILSRGFTYMVQRFTQFAATASRQRSAPRRLPTMKQLTWTFRLWVQSLGVAGIIGLGLFACAAAFYLSAMPVLRADQDRLVQELRAMEVATRPGEEALTHAPSTPREQLDEFYKAFPGLQETPTALRTIYRLAGHHHLELASGHYHVTDDPTNRLVRYEVSLPVTGSYADMRRFLRALLTKVPNAAIDKVDFEKTAENEAGIKATLALTLYSRRDSE